MAARDYGAFLSFMREEQQADATGADVAGLGLEGEAVNKERIDRLCERMELTAGD